MNPWRFLSTTEFKIFITFFLIYFIFISWGGANEYSILGLTKSIADQHKLSIDDYANITPDKALINGHFYSDKAPGLSFISVPLYLSLKQIFLPFSSLSDFRDSGQYLTFSVPQRNLDYVDFLHPSKFDRITFIFLTTFTSVIFGSLSLVILYKILSMFSKNEILKLLVIFSVGLGTSLFAFSTIYYGETASTFFILLSFYFLLKLDSRRNKYFLFLSGLFAGMAVITEYYVAVIAFVFFLYLIRLKIKKSPFYLSGLILGLLPLLLYNFSIFGTPFDLTVFHSVLFDFASTDSPLERVYIITIAITERIKLNIALLIRWLLFPNEGLFFFSPFLLFFILGFFVAYKKHRQISIMILASFLIFVIFMSLLKFNFPGRSFFGYRFFTPIIPFLSIFVLFFLENFRKSRFFSLFLLLSIISIFVYFVGLQPRIDLTDSYQRTHDDEAFTAKITKLSPFENIFVDHYLKQFTSVGPRSRLFESLITGVNFDIRFLTFSDREEFKSLHSTTYPPFLPLFFIPFILSVIWIKNIKLKISVSLLIILISILYYLLWPQIFESSKSGVIFEDGFYSKLPDEDGVWMTNSGRLIIKGNYSSPPIAFHLKIGSFFEDKRLNIYLNDKFMETVLIKKDAGIDYRLNLNTSLRRNVIFFNTSETCKIPGTIRELNMPETRCLNLFVSNQPTLIV